MEVLTLRDFHISLEVLKLIGHYSGFDKRKVTKINKVTNREGIVTCILELSENKLNSENKTIYQITIYEDEIECIINNQYKYIIRKSQDNQITILFQDCPLNTIEINKVKDFRKNYIKRKKREY